MYLGDFGVFISPTKTNYNPAAGLLAGHFYFGPYTHSTIGLQGPGIR